jgi:pimeloyl-ACP methyl ester carboxylesterase
MAGLVMLGPSCAHRDDDSRGTAPVGPPASSWNGFEKKTFVVDGHAAYVVVPPLSAPGKPWVWRTSFPDYQPVVDLELVRAGWHIGYVEVLDMLGSDASLDLMDRFYDTVRSGWGLAAKMALEPCSRGGLPAYRYAARHPERVACIYADSPVMDFKSWPLAWTRDRETEWPKVLEAYGFRDMAQALAYKGNPIDQLAPIARERIAIRHVIAMNDQVVPPELNTLEARRRLRRMGSDLEVVSVKEGSEFWGHHFTYPDVFGSVRFVMDHSYVLPAGREYFRLRDGLANCDSKFSAGGRGRVVFLGGSITFNPGWRDEVMRYLSQRYPQTRFDFVAAGIPSLGSVPHAFRIDRDVLAGGPVDLIFVEAAVNDHNYDTYPNRSELALRGMEGVVRHLRLANPMTDVVELHFVHDEHLRVYDEGETPYTIAEHERVATRYGCPSLELAREVSDRIRAHEFTWAGDFRDIHPSPYGQLLYANSITRMLDAAFAAPHGPARPHPVPAPLDQWSYFSGRFGRLSDIRCVRGFSLDPSWKPSDGKPTRDGFVNVPAVVGSEPGAEFDFDFEGRDAGLLITAGPDAGTIESSVDGAPWRRIDTFTLWSGALHLPWAIMLSDGLHPGPHSVRVRIAPGHNPNSVGTALRVQQLLLN